MRAVLPAGFALKLRFPLRRARRSACGRVSGRPAAIRFRFCFRFRARRPPREARSRHDATAIAPLQRPASNDRAPATAAVIAPRRHIAPRRRNARLPGRPAAICLTIVNDPPHPAFNLAMRRSPAYAVPIRCASDAQRRGRRIRARPPSPARFAKAAASVPEAPQPLVSPRPRAPRRPRQCVPVPPARRSDAVRVARSAT